MLKLHCTHIVTDGFINPAYPLSEQLWNYSNGTKCATLSARSLAFSEIGISGRYGVFLLHQEMKEDLFSTFPLTFRPVLKLPAVPVSGNDKN